MWVIRILQVAAFLVLCSQCESKLITSLPGLDGEVGFKQYSDYITVGDTSEKRLFYWYMESQSDPATDPLVLWLNGGPGCSSFGGLFEELGPFYVRPNITLGRNEYSWNRIANLLFLESPAGVGFSKSTDPKDYRTNDNTTATDSLNFLLKFLQAFPHLKSHDFWMTGESYAGHYIPTLVQKIMEHNSQFPADQINLKGLMIGNPLTYLTINNGGVTDYVYSHNLIANETYQGIKKYCNYSFPSGGGEIFDQAKCNKYSEDSATEMGTINPYDIYVDVCLQGKSSKDAIALMTMLASSQLPGSTFARQRLINIQGYIESKGKLGSPYYPCQDSYTSKYLNDPLVQKAIHADSTSWEDCNMEINIAYSKADVAQSMLPIYTNSILHHGLKVLVYSGDVDSVVPATATRRCINELNLPITSKWRYWTDSDGQVGGYTEVYDGLTYATVRNAGHEVPSFQPMRAYDMFTRFIKTGSVIKK